MFPDGQFSTFKNNKVIFAQVPKQSLIKQSLDLSRSLAVEFLQCETLKSCNLFLMTSRNF